MMNTALFLLAAILTLRAVEWARYRNQAEAVRSIAQRDIAALVRPSDHWYQVIAMACAWLEIGLSVVLAAGMPPALGAVLAAPVIAGRFRALQEIGHTALHLGFGNRKQLQWQIADWLGNFWLFKGNSRTRFQGHCVEHHPQANTENDPNIQRLRTIGFVPGLPRHRFRAFLLHPVMPAGLAETARLYRRALGTGAEPLIRLAFQALALAALGTGFGAWACVAWLLALGVVYPLFSWWSLLAEHRWFAEGNRHSRLLHDCTVTPRTTYSGVEAVLMRYFISPCTDSRHLAHHIYPRLHWHYLHLADRHLEQHEPAYRVHTRTSLFGRDALSILAELESRFVVPTAEAVNHVE